MLIVSLFFYREMEVFSQHHPVPFSKMLTFYRKEPFSIKAFYSSPIPYPDNYIGKKSRLCFSQ